MSELSNQRPPSKGDSLPFFYGITIVNAALLTRLVLSHFFPNASFVLLLGIGIIVGILFLVLYCRLELIHDPDYLSCLGVICFLALLMFPVFQTAREKARQSHCASNLHVIGQAMLLYTQDYDDHLPLSENWQASTTPFLPAKQRRNSFICPAAGKESSYAFESSVSGVALSKIEKPEITPLVRDADITKRHGTSYNVLFTNGAVIRVNKGETPEQAYARKKASSTR